MNSGEFKFWRWATTFPILHFVEKEAQASGTKATVSSLSGTGLTPAGRLALPIIRMGSLQVVAGVRAVSQISRPGLKRLASQAATNSCLGRRDIVFPNATPNDIFSGIIKGTGEPSFSSLFHFAFALPCTAAAYHPWDLIGILHFTFLTSNFTSMPPAIISREGHQPPASSTHCLHTQAMHPFTLEALESNHGPFILPTT